MRLRVGSAREENLSISIDNRAPPSCEGIKSRIGIGSNQSKGRCGTTWDGYRRCCHDWRARVPRVVCGSGGPATFSPRSQGLPRSLQIPSTSARTITQANPYPLQLKKKGASFSPRRRRRGERGEGGGRLGSSCAWGWVLKTTDPIRSPDPNHDDKDSSSCCGSRLTHLSLLIDLSRAAP